MHKLRKTNSSIKFSVFAGGQTAILKIRLGNFFTILGGIIVYTEQPCHQAHIPLFVTRVCAVDSALPRLKSEKSLGTRWYTETPEMLN